MNDIDHKALEHACQCAGRSVHHFDRMALDLPLRASIVAHARAIEQHEAFRQEVSDAVGAYLGHERPWPDTSLRRFIIPKPVDPLVEALRDWSESDMGFVEAESLRAAMLARGYEFTKIGENAGE